MAEFSVERPLFDRDTRQVELRSIIEKHVGRLQMDGNVVFKRALHGPGARNGWDWKIGERLTWSFGVGLGTTDAGSQLILKSRIEFEFGRKHN